MIKVIVCGGRDFKNMEMLSYHLNLYLQNYDFGDIEIVSGTADGADRLGEQWAADKGVKVKRFPADWDRFGKSAGYKRNVEMVNYATHCIAFWNGKVSGSGTKHTINIAREKGLPLKIVRY